MKGWVRWYGELAHIANVAHKTNKRKIESYPTNLIKTITLDVNHYSFLEKKNSPQHDTCGVTALAAVLEAGPEISPKKCKKIKYCKSSRKGPTRKIIQVLLNSGSDGDLIFHKKEHPKAIPT